MRHYSKKLILFIAIIFLLSIIFTWYLTPLNKNISTSLCSMDGHQINVTFNLSWHRHIVRPTELWGRITIDDTVYYSIHETNTLINNGNLRDNFIRKLKNETPIQWFIIPSDNTFDMHKNNIQVVQLDRDFNRIYMMVVRDGILTTYYGPAENEKEANIISSRLN